MNTMIKETDNLIDFACKVSGGSRILCEIGAEYLTNGLAIIKEELNLLGTNLDEVKKKYKINFDNSDDVKDLREFSKEYLTTHIEENFHKSHRNQLPELIKLAKKVELIHTSHPECPNGLASHLEKMFEELVEHMDKEEAILFPLLRQNKIEMAAGPIYVMQQEHISHIVEIKKLAAISNNFSPPCDSCHSWRILYQILYDFKVLLCEHIHIENNILFVN